MNSARSTLIVISLLGLLTGCFGGGGGGSSNGGNGYTRKEYAPVYSCYSDFDVSGSSVSGTFCDGMILNGSQTAGVYRSFLENLWGHAGIPNAFAAGVNKINISCTVGNQVTLDVTVLGQNETIRADCVADMDLSIRKALVETFAGKTLIAEYSGGGSVLDQGRILDFSALNAGDPILDEDLGGLSAVIEGDDEGVCRNKYTFNGNGTVTIELNVTATNAVGSGNVNTDYDGNLTNEQYCYNLEGNLHGKRQDGPMQELFDTNGDGEITIADINSFPFNGNAADVETLCTAGNTCDVSHYTKDMGFRFRDGFIEIDPEQENGKFTFSDGANIADPTDPVNRKLKNYSRFCIKKSGVDECDTNAYQNYKPLPEI